MKISIITINYNNAIGLKKTMGSVFSQSLSDFEYIVIDGASSDESVEIIKSFEENKKSFFFHWISEPDTGIYNAMNKGINKSTGEFLLFLNSGDYLNNNLVLEKCNSIIDGSSEIYSGKMMYFDNKKEITFLPPQKLGLFQSVYQNLKHPSTFIKRTLFERYGLYNENNKIISDAEFFILCSGINECTYQPIDVIISNFVADGISSTNLKLKEKEATNLFKNFFSPRTIQELEERLKLENKLREPVYIYLEKLKNNKKLFGITMYILRKLVSINQLFLRNKLNNIEN